MKTAVEIYLEDRQDTEKTGSGKSERTFQAENKQQKQRFREENRDCIQETESNTERLEYISMQEKKQDLRQEG